MNRKAIIELAMEAANDWDYGYDSGFALEKLKEIDSDYDWESELHQLELEENHREMGPRRPPSELEQMLMGIYKSEITRLLGPSSFLASFDKETQITGKSFVIPLQIGKNNE